MKQRMRLLSILLAGSIAFGATGYYINAAERKGAAGPVAGAIHMFSEELNAQNAATEAEQRNKAVRALEREQPADERTGEQEAVQDAQTEAETATAAGHEVPVVASEYADIAIAQVNHYVNVRALPNTESEVLGKLYNDSAATVLETTEDGWYKIVSGSVEGYVKAEYVVVGDENLARAVGTRYATVTTTTLFVRNEPTTEARILTMLPEGDDLVVLDESTEGWVKVSTVEGDGYVSADYVTLSTEYIHAESKAEEEARLAREEAERQAAARAAEEARRAREAEEAAKRKKEQAAAKKEASKASRPSSGSAASNNAGTGGTTAPQAGSVSNGQAVVNYGMQFLGNPYVFGGTSLTNGADCSGFVQSVYAAFGVKLPRNSTAQRSAGYGVSLSEIQPGDLVCYSGHIGIYAGNNTLLHASNERTGITLTSPVTYREVIAVRRIF